MLDFTLAEGQSFWMQGQRHSWLLRGLHFVKVTARAAILPVIPAGVFETAALGTGVYQM